MIEVDLADVLEAVSGHQGGAVCWFESRDMNQR
jgi:hypothetical protein